MSRRVILIASLLTGAFSLPSSRALTQGERGESLRDEAAYEAVCRLLPDQSIRLSTHDGTEIDGRFSRNSRDSIYVRSPRGPSIIAFSEVDRLWVHRHSQGTGFVLGSLVGFTLLAGAFVMSLDDSPADDVGAFEYVWSTSVIGLMGGAVGGFVGAMIGWAIPSWKLIHDSPSEPDLEFRGGTSHRPSRFRAEIGLGTGAGGAVRGVEGRVVVTGTNLHLGVEYLRMDEEVAAHPSLPLGSYDPTIRSSVISFLIGPSVGRGVVRPYGMVGLGIVHEASTTAYGFSSGSGTYVRPVAEERDGFGLSTSAGMRLGRSRLGAFAQGRWLVLTTRASYTDVLLWTAGVGVRF